MIQMKAMGGKGEKSYDRIYVDMRFIYVCTV